MNSARSTLGTIEVPVMLYNTMSRSLVPLTPLNPGEVKFYCCGPTVYNYQHIGNLRTYVFEDLLSRMLKHADFKVTHVMNITDVGHLVSDADEGEDKMLLAQKREGKKSYEIAEYYTGVFLSDCSELNINRPTIICKATDHISHMIRLIERLIENGFAYISAGNVYFDVSKNADYGKLSGQSLDSLKSGARIDVDSAKRSPLDFALWFTKSKFENQELQWDSPWGLGYPGWHIECSAMAMEYLGESFDIHCGGIDHIPVHHTNEIAQSECASGQKFASIWMHGGFLVESSGKMSKSKGVFLTLKVLKEKGYSPLAYRYLCLSSHYRNELSWSWESIEGAQNALNRLKSRISSLGLSKNSIESSHYTNGSESEQYRLDFLKSLRTDLNAPQALSKMYDMLSNKNIINSDKGHLIAEFDLILGLNLLGQELVEAPPSDEIIELAKSREKARLERNFSESDRLRDEILELGFIIEDSPQGFKLKRTI